MNDLKSSPEMEYVRQMGEKRETGLLPFTVPHISLSRLLLGSLVEESEKSHSQMA